MVVLSSISTSTLWTIVRPMTAFSTFVTISTLLVVVSSSLIFGGAILSIVAYLFTDSAFSTFFDLAVIGLHLLTLPFFVSSLILIVLSINSEPVAVVL